MYRIRHALCGHLHHYEPIKPCEAGFSFEAGICRAEGLTPPELGNTIPLFDSPYCENCVKYDRKPNFLDEIIEEIRRHYAREGIKLLEHGKELGLSHHEINTEILELNSRRNEEIKALQVNAWPEASNNRPGEDPVGISALGKRVAALRLDRFNQ